MNDLNLYVRFSFWKKKEIITLPLCEWRSLSRLIFFLLIKWYIDFSLSAVRCVLILKLIFAPHSIDSLLLAYFYLLAWILNYLMMDYISWLKRLMDWSNMSWMRIFIISFLVDGCESWYISRFLFILSKSSTWRLWLQNWSQVDILIILRINMLKSFSRFINYKLCRGIIPFHIVALLD